jgi:hypothetical protein
LVRESLSVANGSFLFPSLSPGFYAIRINPVVVGVIRALFEEGHSLADFIYGDSSGGGLAAGAVLKNARPGVGNAIGRRFGISMA